ncbi:hypothetical protein BH11PSE8_BH11PSE8_20680 [soil metagenome]
MQNRGSTGLLETPPRHDPIDEYRLFIFPLLLGTGKRLIGSGTMPMAFEQVEWATSSEVATVLRLRRSGKAGHGQMGARWSPKGSRTWGPMRKQFASCTPRSTTL